MIDLSTKLSKDYIQSLVLRPDKVGMMAVGQALLLIDKRQTKMEREHKEVLRRNGQGFTPADAYLGSSMANFYRGNGFLTKKQLDYWRKPDARGIPRICKYWKQLQEEALKKYGLTELPKKKKTILPATNQFDLGENI